MSTSEMPPERADVTKKLRSVKVEPEPEDLDPEPIDDPADSYELADADVAESDPDQLAEIDELVDTAELSAISSASDASSDKDDFDADAAVEDKQVAPVRRLRRKPTRGELIIFLIIVVLLIVICVSVLPLIGTLLQTIQFNDESSHLLLPMLSA